MPSRIAITARRSALCSQRAESPCPSDPSTSATRCTPATASSIATASSARVSATVVNPRAVRSGSASYQSGRRVHGVVNTAPMPTLIERR